MTKREWLIGIGLAAIGFGLFQLTHSPQAQASSIIPGGTLSIDLIQTIQTTGLYRGKTAYAFQIMGRRAGFTSTSVLNDIVEFANAVAAIPTLTGVEPLEIVSSSASDAAAGTGIRTVAVTYIDATNNLVQSAPITLNGTTPVAAGFTAMEPLWMESNSTGTGTVAAGDIRLRIVAGAVECEQISTGGNKSQSGRFMVPTGFTGYIPVWDGHAINNDQDLRLRGQVSSLNRTFLPSYHFMDTNYIAANTSFEALLPFLKLPPLAKVKVSTFSGATAAAVRANISFTVVILKD